MSTCRSLKDPSQVLHYARRTDYEYDVQASKAKTSPIPMIANLIILRHNQPRENPVSPPSAIGSPAEIRLESIKACLHH
jgi:hypothetical protein